jgi:hypothetical protein
MTLLGYALLVVLGAAGAACASPRFTVERTADGTQHLRCKLSLPDCLVEAERRCQGRHYVVLRAVDEHERRGGSELSLDTRTSEALFRCGPAIGWPAGVDPMAVAPEPALAAPPPAAPAPSAATAPRACVPGVSSPCAGPAGCAGGQACLADGSGYGPCDCGGNGGRP